MRRPLKCYTSKPLSFLPAKEASSQTLILKMKARTFTELITNAQSAFALPITTPDKLQNKAAARACTISLLNSHGVRDGKVFDQLFINSENSRLCLQVRQHF